MTLNGSIGEIKRAERLSIVAVENEIGNGSQRASEIGSAIPVQAGLGARGEIEGHCPRSLEGPGFVDQRRYLLRADAFKSLFLEHRSHEAFSRSAVALERVDQGQRDLAFFQIAQHRLAKLFRRGCEIQNVVH